MFGAEADLRSFLAGFEEGTWPASRWNHATHVAMAACYLREHQPEEALLRIRSGLYRYHLSQGGAHTATSGYHETLTLFWVARITEYLRALPPDTPLLDAVNGATRQFGQQRKLHKSYYSWDIVNDPEARRSWRAPDLDRRLNPK